MPFDLEEFDQHTLVSFVYDEETELSGVIAIHRANKGVPSFGATRMWHYSEFVGGVCDALRLSRLMSYKAALAGLPCGGAKAVIFEKPIYKTDEDKRAMALRAYANRVNLLSNAFITGTDVGISQKDIEIMHEVSPQIIGFHDNTTEFTALGVFETIKASCKEAFGSDDLAGKKFAIQGLGKIGKALLEQLIPIIGPSGKIIVSDVDVRQIEAIQDLYPQVEVVRPSEIHSQEVDVFSPCALSGAINEKTVGEIRAKVIAGGANNQLHTEEVGDTLFAQGITYAPDYVANAGGIIAIYNEYENPNSSDVQWVRERVATIPVTLEKIFQESHATQRAPHRVANEMAEKIFNEYV